MPVSQTLESAAAMLQEVVRDVAKSNDPELKRFMLLLPEVINRVLTIQMRVQFLDSSQESLDALIAEFDSGIDWLKDVAKEVARLYHGALVASAEEVSK